MIWVILFASLLLPITLLVAALIVDSFISQATLRPFFLKLACPFGFVLFFEQYLQALPLITSLATGTFSAMQFAALCSQIFWLGSSFALVLILIVTLVELPLRWFAGNYEAGCLSASIEAVRPLVVVVLVALFAKQLSFWFVFEKLGF